MVIWSCKKWFVDEEENIQFTRPRAALSSENTSGMAL